MESVLHTLLIILFILIPGFIFRRAYFQGGFSKQFDSKSWSHSIFYSIIFGLIIEIISIYIFSKFIKLVDGDSIIDFYQCISSNEIPSWVFDISVLKNLLYFFLILFFTSFILAQILYQFVRRFKLDRKLLSLRFNNHWHYYFTGEIKDFKEYKHINGSFQCSHVDVLVNTEDGDNRLYTGFLASHTINSTTGDLEAIYLTFPRRYDRKESKWKDINSDVLIIPYSKVINLNIRFSFKEKKPFRFPLQIIEPLLLLIISIFLWWDNYNLFSDYDLFSNILIKLSLQLCILLFFTTINSFSTYIYNKEIIEENKKEEQKTIAVNNLKAFITLSIIILIVIYITY